ncbi:hypothetical protein F6X40_24255, partial [Paraburkholderia sp. UCT31]|nr:hypothetical protein [Paraburkholderia sp. UCT31]
MKTIIAVALGAALAFGSQLAHADSTYTLRIPFAGLVGEQPSAPLYDFTSFTFTPCSAYGVYGPSLAQCHIAYGPASWAQNPAYFSVTNGVQTWVVPEDGNYQITVAGAVGGNGTNYQSAQYPGYGGKGAVLTAVVSLKKGTVLSLMVGQRGSTSTLDGGGGGGTFVAQGSTPLMVAGAGGGSTPYSPFTGDNASLTTTGTCSYDASLAGTNESGGSSVSSTGGAGGSGFSGNGASTGQFGGQSYSFLNGGVSGGTSNGCNKAAPGGFGGGGGAGCWGCLLDTSPSPRDIS